MAKRGRKPKVTRREITKEDVEGFTPVGIRTKRRLCTVPYTVRSGICVKALGGIKIGDLFKIEVHPQRRRVLLYKAEPYEDNTFSVSKAFVLQSRALQSKLREGRISGPAKGVEAVRYNYRDGYFLSW